MYIVYNIYIYIYGCIYIYVYMRPDVFGSVLDPQNLSWCKTVHFWSFESKMNRHNFMIFMVLPERYCSFRGFLKVAAIEDHMHCSEKSIK